jgi:hypothetical protein
MMAGAKSRRDVGWRHEFPGDFKRGKRMMLAMFGVLIGMNLLSFLASASEQEPSGASLNRLIVVPLLVVWVVVACLRVPIVFERYWLKLKGEAFVLESIERMDVFIPRGKPGAKVYGLRLVFTINEPQGQRFKEVKTAAKADHVIRLLEEARARLPHAVICDHSGFLPAHLWCTAPSGGRSQEDPRTGPPSGRPSSPERPLRISPSDGDWYYPARIASQRDQQLGGRGATHMRRLQMASVQHERVRIGCPRVVAEWA